MSGDFACASDHKAGPYDTKVTEHFMTLLNNAQRSPIGQVSGFEVSIIYNVGL